MLLGYFCFSDLVCEVNCGDREGEIVCGRRVLALVALNLDLDWDDVIPPSTIDGADISLHFDGLGDGR